MRYRLFGALMLAAAAALLTAGWISDRRNTIRLAEALAAALERMAGRIRWQNMPLPRVLREECDSSISGRYFTKLCEKLKSEVPLHTLWQETFFTIEDQTTRDVINKVELRGDAGQVMGTLHLAAEELRGYARSLAAQQQLKERLFATVCGGIAAIIIVMLI